MRNTLYIIAAILMIFWAFGYFGLNTGVHIHLLIVIASISLLIRVLYDKKIAN